MTDHTELMTAFKRAFAKADGEALRTVVTSDFEWHLHWFPTGARLASGRIRRGVDEVMAEIEWRAEHWSKVRFDGVTERYLDDLVVQTFTISGIDDAGERFKVDAVDLYRVVEGRLASKDTYWKRPATAGEEHL